MRRGARWKSGTARGRNYIGTQDLLGGNKEKNRLTTVTPCLWLVTAKGGKIVHAACGLPAASSDPGILEWRVGRWRLHDQSSPPWQQNPDTTETTNDRRLPAILTCRFRLVESLAGCWFHDYGRRGGGHLSSHTFGPGTLPIRKLNGSEGSLRSSGSGPGGAAGIGTQCQQQNPRGEGSVRSR